MPQFSIAHDGLTVRECVAYSMKLRVRGMQGAPLDEAVIRILDEVNMAEFSDRLVKVLSGGQKRRLALAMELASKPVMLLADEVTSGLDPQSEDEIVEAPARCCRAPDGRVVLSVTHSLQHLSYYDSVLVLYQGVTAYHGPPEYLTHYFRCEDPQEVYAQLVLRDARDWSQSWIKHRAAFIEAMSGQASSDLESVTYESPEEPKEIIVEEPAPTFAPSEVSASAGRVQPILHAHGTALPYFLPQQSADLPAQLGLIFGFPILVAIFAWNGLPAVQNLSMGLDTNVVQQLQEKHEVPGAGQQDRQPCFRHRDVPGDPPDADGSE